jgi:hypothetical protein
VVATPVVPALRRLRQEDLEFKAHQGYTVIPVSTTTKHTHTHTHNDSQAFSLGHFKKI